MARVASFRVGRPAEFKVLSDRGQWSTGLAGSRMEAMPVVQDNGATYVFKLRKGIFFTPDPAFKGKPRELTAADQAYAIKRLLDPAVKSPWQWLVDGKIIGADEVRAQATRTGKLD